MRFLDVFQGLEKSVACQLIISCIGREGKNFMGNSGGELGQWG
jgi:hypothetical protein